MLGGAPSHDAANNLLQAFVKKKVSDDIVRTGEVNDVPEEFYKYHPRQSLLLEGWGKNNRDLGRMIQNKKDKAAVILGTMVSMMNFEAPNSIVDEAGQCTEAHTLCMINRLTKFDYF